MADRPTARATHHQRRRLHRYYQPLGGRAPRPRNAGHRQDPTVEAREFLRTLIEAEIASRDASNASTRLRPAAFPVTNGLEEFDIAASLTPVATCDYLASLEWVRAAENLTLIGLAGNGKSHMLVALGISAVQAGCRVRYLTAAELVETHYRDVADNSVGRVIDPFCATTSCW